MTLGGDQEGWGHWVSASLLGALGQVLGFCLRPWHIFGEKRQIRAVHLSNKEFEQMFLPCDYCINKAAQPRNVDVALGSITDQDSAKCTGGGMQIPRKNYTISHKS